MEFIGLHSIFNDDLVISSIPNYFNNSETPIIFFINITNQLGLLYLKRTATLIISMSQDLTEGTFWQ